MGALVEPVDRADVAFEGGSHTIAAARDFTVAFLTRAAAAGAELGELLVEQARLIVSELVTNAVKYAAGPLSLFLELRRESLSIAVVDASGVLPTPRGHDPERVGQHGLEIVKMLCRTVDVTPEGDGKRVTALISLH